MSVERAVLVLITPRIVVNEEEELVFDPTRLPANSR
jgi:hypothetical protein